MHTRQLLLLLLPLLVLLLALLVLLLPLARVLLSHVLTWCTGVKAEVQQRHGQPWHLE